jgi:asparagine synthase (glutamine-hydrolysing)
MCGITGILHLNGQPARREGLEKMNGTIAHRGPDGEGFFLDGPVGLGHRRLSIIDLEAGKQPMQSTDGQSVIVFNGEIYNYPVLRDALLKKGYPFQTHSDTEVILALYQLEGEQGFQKLAGMFAFALWDKARQRLLLVRDRAGMKPLYVAQHKAQLFFSSEIKAIRAALPALGEIDHSAVNFYFSRQYIGGETTIFSQIKKVRPGTWLDIGADGRIKEEVYWKLPPVSPKKISIEEAENQTDSLLRKAVQSHLIADVPVGLFLSGGLDSSTLLSYAAENTAQPLQTFSVGFGENNALNEVHFARQLAQRYGTAHHEIHVTEKEVLDCLPHIIQHLDEPLADYAVLPTYVMSRFAAQHVKVVLSGEGADELFGGYKRYQAYSLFDRLPFSGLFENRLPGPSVFKEQQRKQLLRRDIFMENSQLPQERQLLADKKYFSPAGQVNSMLYADMRNWLVDDLLMKVDKMGMLASIEARIPFLDHALVEYVAPLDGRLKVSLKEKKILLRKVATQRLPPEIFNRPKHGFTVPVGEWLRGALKGTFEDVVLNDRTNEQWFDMAFVKKLFGEHLAGKNHRLQLWAILIFCLWHRQQGKAQ